ncbi:FliM/FliN family flagellar motor switch protein [Pseudomonas vanderleydeniana]|uniref:FliM/FliN family flagellar motor switch protein n=1 Tax=Pseudomonas vanderleydeniana TaxID=2745495 RepID=A0A9E6PRS3_9PSED|nr:FliM/FliN family flagellar motor switch protein [Pseudomonas vanderleydeniana]QXI31262.1 FliM/FliN family flagellar motor switch protein [Pseudomonas vanderleydeniana]
MALHALQLRTMSLAEAQVRERLGAGLCLRLSPPHTTTLHLRLAPGPVDLAPRTAIESACGAFWLDDALALLSRLSECPAILAGTPENGDWYWPLYNHYLAPELQALLSPLRVSGASPATGLDCLLELRDDDGQRQAHRARIPARTLLALLDHPHWQVPRQTPGTAQWRLRLPLLLGHCPLTLGQLHGLRPGDVLLVEQPLFSPTGDGSLQLGTCRLHLQQLPGTTLRFTLTELEAPSMNASLDHFAFTDHEPLNPVASPYPSDVGELSEPEGDLSRFDDLPLALTLRAGSLNLSLGQLRNLGVGSVLTFSGCVPGQATLCQGERPLAHGELVEIDGRLGLQITRLEPRQ